ncbi:MAG: TetR/AcrR family transcriptional regulator [Actinomycetes bacterium]
MPRDRRASIADAAISTLASSGSRGLTHRAVDRSAGLPLGSTSYYFRTRADLLKAAVDRLAELDSAALELARGDSLADDLARVVGHLLTSERDRLLARYELALESVRRPELRQLMNAGTRRVRDVIAERLRERQSADADSLADDVLALIDGLLLAELTARHGGPRSRADFESSLTRLLRSR